MGRGPFSYLTNADLNDRWNPTIIEPLVRGAQETLIKNGVKSANIHISSCPGSFELPFATQSLISQSQVAASASSTISATDLLSDGLEDARTSSAGPLHTAFDAIISIGVLIKGETMHFEYICDAVAHSLMRIQLDSRIPVIFGVLTVLTEAQAMARAGLDGKKHNHGESWGEAAVEMALKKTNAL